VHHDTQACWCGACQRKALTELKRQGRSWSA
jgi:hypothetical protein